MLIPLKHVEPFLIRVDSGTGLVDVVPLYAGKAPMDESVTRYFLTHYVSICERFYIQPPRATMRNAGHSTTRSETKPGTHSGILAIRAHRSTCTRMAA